VQRATNPATLDPVHGWTIVVASMALVSCQTGMEEPAPPPPPDTKPPPPVAAKPAEQPDAGPKPTTWTFAVMSDLHLPNYKLATVNKTVAALVAMHPRFVVITGDHTNGGALDGPLRARHAPMWWKTITQALQPLRTAGIPVLPVAGNHDNYLAWHREGYATAFADLDKWAAPLVVKAHAQDAKLSPARAPFSYSVDVDDVHLSLTHVVAQHLERDVAAWLVDDLAAAASAKHRLVFGHVPMSSVIQPPSRTFIAKFGAILEAGHVEMYIAGHEHIVWDENVQLPAGSILRQVIVGCSSGFYDFAPNDASKRRAGCTPTVRAGVRDPIRCKMPNGGGEFVLARGRKNRQIQHYKNSFTIFTVDGDKISPRPMTVDDQGHLLPFYLNE
jgi:predicted phosphodiesterase